MAADPEVTGAVAPAEDVPPPPDAKPAEGPASASVEEPRPKKAKAKPRTKSAKRAFNRLRRLFDD